MHNSFIWHTSQAHVWQWQTVINLPHQESAVWVSVEEWMRGRKMAKKGEEKPTRWQVKEMKKSKGKKIKNPLDRNQWWEEAAPGNHLQNSQVIKKNPGKKKKEENLNH